jgi:hypothetical protein
MRKFESLVYLPEKAEFPDGENGNRYNIWRKDGVAAKPGDVTPFLVHMAYLFPDEKDRDHVLDYLALLVQRPADKIHFALLIRGAQGTGKSWIGRLMEKIVGSRNTVRPSNEEVVSHWTAWMEGAQLAVIEELMTLGRKEVANRLKPAITDPTIRIEEKNCSLYSIPNCLNFISFTNHEDALPIEHGDRRWLVVFSPAKPRDGAYYRDLFDFLDGDGAAYVKQWLLKRKVGLNPHGVAPFTAGKGGDAAPVDRRCRGVSPGDVRGAAAALRLRPGACRRIGRCRAFGVAWSVEPSCPGVEVPQGRDRRRQPCPLYQGGWEAPRLSALVGTQS